MIQGRDEMKVLQIPDEDILNQKTTNKRKQKLKEKTIDKMRWSMAFKKVVSFYGISSSTAQYGQHIHPQGKKPPIRSNYSELITILQG